MRGFLFETEISVWRVVEQSLQTITIEDPYIFLLNANQPFIVEFRESAADSFKLQPKVGAYFFPSHPQMKLGRRVTPDTHALRQVEQKCRDTLFCTHGTEQNHQALIAHNFTAHEFMKLLLQ